MQRSDNWREIQRCKDNNDMKANEAGDQADKLKQLDFDLQRTQQRIDDYQKIIDSRNYDLRNKQLLTEDLEKEIMRNKD